MIGTLTAIRSTIVLRRMLVPVLVSAALAGTAMLGMAQVAGEGGNSLGFDMAPETNQRVIETAIKEIPTPMAPGPVKPTWASLQEN